MKPAGPPPAAPGPLAGKASESSTLRGSEADRHDGQTDDMNEKKNATNPEGGQSSATPNGTTA